MRLASLRRYGIGIGGEGESAAIAAIKEAAAQVAAEEAEVAAKADGLAMAAAASIGSANMGVVNATSSTAEAEAQAAATDMHVLGGGTAGGSGGVMVRPRAKVQKRKQQHVVIIRHGKTGHNKLGLFTGCEAAALAGQLFHSRLPGRAAPFHISFLRSSFSAVSCAQLPAKSPLSGGSPSTALSAASSACMQMGGRRAGRPGPGGGQARRAHAARARHPIRRRLHELAAARHRGLSPG